MERFCTAPGCKRDGTVLCSACERWHCEGCLTGGVCARCRVQRQDQEEEARRRRKEEEPVARCTTSVTVEGGPRPETTTRTTGSTGAPRALSLTVTLRPPKGANRPTSVRVDFHPTVLKNMWRGEDTPHLSVCGFERPTLALETAGTDARGFLVLGNALTVADGRVVPKAKGQAMIVGHVGSKLEPASSGPDPGCVSLHTFVESEPPTLAIPGIPAERLLFSKDASPGPNFFLVSNEKDWDARRSQIAPRTTTVTISFSNNVGWDQAVASKSEALVLCDWHPAPLRLQELLIRPLLRVAESAAELLSFVLLEPLVGSPDGLEQTCLALRQQLERKEHDRRATLIRTLLERLESADVTEAQRVAVAAYCKAVDALRATGGQTAYPFDLPYEDKGMSEPVLGVLEGSATARDLGQHLFDGLEARYARAAWSCLSSPENFARLRQLFRDGVYYACGTITDPALFVAIAEAFGAVSFTLNTSNVLHYLDKDASRARFIENHAKRLRDITRPFTGSGRTSSMRVAFTGGLGGKHDYFELDLDLTQQALPQVEKAVNEYDLRFE